MKPKVIASPVPRKNINIQGSLSDSLITGMSIEISSPPIAASAMPKPVRV